MLAALEYMAGECQCRELLLGGYSFGAMMALSAAAQWQGTPVISRLMLVAPPLQMAVQLALPAGTPGLAILGGQDAERALQYGVSEGSLRLREWIVRHMMAQAHNRNRVSDWFSVTVATV